jgi:hypothetical protein
VDAAIGEILLVGGYDTYLVLTAMCGQFAINEGHFSTCVGLLDEGADVNTTCVALQDPSRYSYLSTCNTTPR